MQGMASSLSDLGDRSERVGRARTNLHDFEAHSGHYATRKRGDSGRSPISAVDWPYVRQAAKLLVLVFASCLSLEACKAEMWHPMPDAAYGVFLDPGSLQGFMAHLPLPARERLRSQAGEPLRPGQGLVVAFLGTSAEAARLRIDRVEMGEHRVSVHLALHRAERSPGDSLQPHYPLATVRLARLPHPPFDVSFLGERGSCSRGSMM